MGISDKYGTVATGHRFIPDDEPVFVIRAADMLAPGAVRAYMNLARDQGLLPEYVDSIRQAYEVMAAWQVAHPDRVKVPDD
jgi:hypothetical protein